jgi:hypothetical protein
LVGRDSHPLDDSPYFYEGIRTFFPYGPALPGRTDASCGKRRFLTELIKSSIAVDSDAIARRLFKRWTIQKRPYLARFAVRKNQTPATALATAAANCAAGYSRGKPY